MNYGSPASYVSQLGILSIRARFTFKQVHLFHVIWVCNDTMRCRLSITTSAPGHVIPRLEGEKLQVMRQFLQTQQMAAQVKHDSSKL